jgi:hypothetical protein
MSAGNETVPGRARLRWRQLRWSTRLCLVAFVVLLLGAGLELMSRLWWRTSRGVRRLDVEAVYRANYPEIEASGIDAMPPSHSDGRFEVLLLGGSVLHRTCGDIGPRLEARLAEKLGRPVRVLNLAHPGRTTRDSLLKYQRLGDRHFDLVLLYHGINDSFVNNCPPGAFRADYGHVPHIAQLQALDHHPEFPWLAAPYTVEYAGLRVANRWAVLPGPRHRWMHYGSDLRTPPAFEANVEAVAAIAASRGDRLLLATYAYHLPPDYSEEAFRAKQLDYDLHACAASTWGLPENIARAIDAHNEAVRNVGARRGLPVIDVNGRMPHSRLCFNDPCHLNAEGCRRFVEMVVEQVEAGN